MPHGDVDHMHGHLRRVESKLVCSSITCFLNGNRDLHRIGGTFFFMSVTINYHKYFQEYGKYLEAELIGSKALNRKQEKIISYLHALAFYFPNAHFLKTPFLTRFLTIYRVPLVLDPGYILRE